MLNELEKDQQLGMQTSSTNNSILTPNPSLLQLTSDYPTDDQLEVLVYGTPGAASRFVANDSLSILEIHRVGLETQGNPVLPSLQNNRTVLGEELETT